MAHAFNIDCHTLFYTEQSKFGLNTCLIFANFKHIGKIVTPVTKPSSCEREKRRKTEIERV